MPPARRAGHTRRGSERHQTVFHGKVVRGSRAYRAPGVSISLPDSGRNRSRAGPPPGRRRGRTGRLARRAGGGDPGNMRKLAAECPGTVALPLAGTGAIVIDDVTGGAVSHVGVALTFGLVVLAMIYTVGDVSGAHLNPAVTLGFFAARRFPGRSVLPYVASQCAGALLASVCLRLMFP